jgi:hypothetical protein
MSDKITLLGAQVSKKMLIGLAITIMIIIAMVVILIVLKKNSDPVFEDGYAIVSVSYLDEFKSLLGIDGFEFNEVAKPSYEQEMHKDNVRLATLKEVQYCWDKNPFDLCRWNWVADSFVEQKDDMFRSAVMFLTDSMNNNMCAGNRGVNYNKNVDIAEGLWIYAPQKLVQNLDQKGMIASANIIPISNNTPISLFKEGYSIYTLLPFKPLGPNGSRNIKTSSILLEQKTVQSMSMGLGIR